MPSATSPINQSWDDHYCAVIVGLVICMCVSTANSLAAAGLACGGGVDPFGTNQSNANELELIDKRPAEVGMRAIGRHLWNEGYSKVQALATEADDALFVEGELALLHNAHFGDGGHPEDVMRTVVQIAKRQFNGQSPTKLLERFRTGDRAESNEGKLILELSEQYEAVTGQSWSFDWRAKREFWLDLVGEIIRSKSEMNPAVLWQRRIEADKANEGLYQQCYLGILRAGFVNLDAWDYSLVDAILDQHSGAAPEDLLWQARLLTTFIFVRLPVENERRVELCNRLSTNLRTAKPTFDERNQFERLASTLGLLYWAADKNLERKRLLWVIRDEWDPMIFWLSTGSALSAREQRQYFLDKRISVDYRNVLLMDALLDLKKRVFLPIWIDEDVGQHQMRITLKMNDGWGNVLDAVLKETPYDLSEIGDQVLCVGNDAATDLVRIGQSSIPTDGSKVANALVQNARMVFYEHPFDDVIECLKQQHDVEIQSPGTLAETPISISISKLPFHVALSLIAKEVNCQWYVANGKIHLVQKTS